MSPEQCRQQVLDGRSDIYSLGCVLYECIAGSAPFDDANPFSVLAGHNGGEIKANADFDRAPARLKQCILKCLQKDPAQRFQNPKELKKSIESIGFEKQDQRQAKATIKLLAKISAIIVLLLCIGSAVINSYRERSYSQARINPQKSEHVSRQLIKAEELADPKRFTPETKVKYLHDWIDKYGQDSATPLSDVVRACDNFCQEAGAEKADRVACAKLALKKLERSSLPEDAQNKYIALDQLGKLSFILLDFQQAEKFIKRSLDVEKTIGQEVHRPVPRSTILTHLASAYRLQGRWNNVLETQQQAVQQIKLVLAEKEKQESDQLSIEREATPAVHFKDQDKFIKTKAQVIADRHHAAVRARNELIDNNMKLCDELLRCGKKSDAEKTVKDIEKELEQNTETQKKLQSMEKQGIAIPDEKRIQNEEKLMELYRRTNFARLYLVFSEQKKANAILLPPLTHAINSSYDNALLRDPVITAIIASAELNDRNTVRAVYDSYVQRGGDTDSLVIVLDQISPVLNLFQMNDLVEHFFEETAQKVTEQDKSRAVCEAWLDIIKARNSIDQGSYTDAWKACTNLQDRIVRLPKSEQDGFQHRWAHSLLICSADGKLELSSSTVQKAVKYMEKKNAHGLDFWDLEPLVKYYNARGDYDRSKKLCRDIITNLSNSDSAEFALPMSKVYLASAFAAQGEYVEAKKLLNEAGPQIELRRGNFPVYFAEYEKLNKLCSQNK